MEIKKLTKEEFPKALLEIPQPPKNLWVVGELPDENLIYLCVVGSRKYTPYGREACEKLIEGLKGYPIAIVSGLAMGIDSIAHKKAIEIGLKTIVFPGSGLSPSSIYPKSNIELMNEVIKSGGCLISEFEPEFKATKWSFPMRNRLMAGTSQATLIIEAEEKSGTLITARLTTEYNRDLLVVPNPIFSPNSRGVNILLRQGATPVTSSEEILEALGFEEEKTVAKQASLFLDLSEGEKNVVSLLQKPMERYDLIEKMGIPIPTANGLLSLMEIKGIIKEELGKIKLV